MQALKQVEIDLASRLKLAEAQSDRLVGRLKAADARMKELKAELAKVSNSLQGEQDSRLQMVQDMSASIMVYSASHAHGRQAS